MANPSLQIGNSNWAIKEDNLLGYSTAGTRFLPQPITMTRASAGTRVNSSGLIETVELLGSEEIVNGDFATDSNWSKNTGWTISGGTANKDSVDTNYLTQDFSGNGQFKITYTISGYVSGDVRLRVGTGFSTIIRTSNGTYTEYITKDSASFGFYGVGEFSIDNVSVKESTKNNLARVDYDGTASSLLVEPERTNLITYSEDFTNAIWIKLALGLGLNPVITSDYTTSPDGTNNASRIIFDRGAVSASNYSMLRTNVTSLTNPHDSSISLYLKSNTASNYTLIWYNEGAGSSPAIIEEIIVTPTWTKYTLSATNISSTSDRLQFGLWDFNGRISSSYADVSVWGAQLEVGSYATSYIPTDGGTVTRVKDQYSKTGISNLINSEEGVLFAEMAALSDDETYRIITLSDGTTNERVYMQYTNISNTIAVVVKNGGSTQANMTYLLSDETAFAKVAIKWKANDFALWVDGVERGTDSSGSVPTGLNKLSFDNTSGTFFYGKVKQLQVFKTALTDTELATLTT